MTAIFLRNGKYLNARYYWDNIPHLFPVAYFSRVLDTAMNFKDRPTGFVIVEPGVVDLDALEVVKI